MSPVIKFLYEIACVVALFYLVGWQLALTWYAICFGIAFVLVIITELAKHPN